MSDKIAFKFLPNGQMVDIAPETVVVAPVAKKSKINSHRISITQTALDNGFSSGMDLLEAYGNDSVMPACCDEGCEFEPDGRCQHGCPSIMLAVGVI